MFKVINKDTRTTPCSSVSVVNSEHVNTNWDNCIWQQTGQSGVWYNNFRHWYVDIGLTNFGGTKISHWIKILTQGDEFL